MKTLKLLLLSFLAVAATVPTAFGQGLGTGNPDANGFNFSLSLLQLPTSTLGPGAPGTAGNATNFYSGYLGVVGYQTNVMSGGLYNPNLAGLFTTASTNIVTNTATIYPTIYLPVPSTVILEYRGTASAGTGTNVVFTFANSLTGRGGMASTANQWTWSVPLNQGIGVPTVATYSFTNLFGTVYLTQELWQGTNGTVTGTLTNLDGGIYWGAEPLTLEPGAP